MNTLMKWLILIQISLSDEKGEGAINTIAVIAGIAVIAAAIVGVLSQMGGPVGDAIREVIERALDAARGG